MRGSSGFNNNSISQTHAVNISEGYKFPAVWYQKSLSENDRKAYTNGHRNIMNAHGQPHQLPSGTEDLMGKSSLQGYELCCAAERIWSDGISQMILGDATIGDNMEKIAFNALPGAVNVPSASILRLTQRAQSTWNQGFVADHGNNLLPASMSAGPAALQLLCGRNSSCIAGPPPSRTACIMAYGPAELNAKVGNGVNVRFVETQTTHSGADPSHLQLHPDGCLSSQTPDSKLVCQSVVKVNSITRAGVTAGTFTPSIAFGPVTIR
jgi:hypothetical protein